MTSNAPRSRGIVARVVIPTLAIGGITIASALMIGGNDQTGSVIGTADTSAAERRGFEITTLAMGELEAKNRVEIRSRVEQTTTIVEVVPEGTRVEKGDVLVRLNSEAIETEIAEDELRVLEAESSYEAAVTAEKIQLSDNASALLTAEAELTIARLSLEQWKDGDVAKTRKTNQLAVERAEKNLERLSDKYEQSQILFEQEFLSEDELDRDEIAFIEAKAALEQARLDQEVYETYQFQKDKTQHELDVKQAEAKLERVLEENEINLRNKKAQTISAQRQFQMRQERLTEEKAQLEACTITAPNNGLVVYGTSTEEGRWRAQNDGGLAIGTQVRNNDLLIVLPDTSEMVASVKVHESLAGRIRAGQKAEVTIEAIDAIIPGEVASVGILAESSGWRDPNLREYTVKIRLSPTADVSEIRPTMRCEARITLGAVEDALVVPLPAVFNDGSIKYVYTPAGSRFRRVPIAIDRTSDTDVEVTAGMSPGDIVLLREPDAGEVLADPFRDEDLEAAGYIKTENGWFHPNSMRRGMMPGMRSGGQPGGEASGSQRQRPQRGGEQSNAGSTDAGTGTKNAEAVAAETDTTDNTTGEAGSGEVVAEAASEND